MQGPADDGTPPRDLGDTYSQSTDPSSDGSDGEDTLAKHDLPGSSTAAGDRRRAVQASPSASAQPAQQHQSLEEEPSVTLDTQNDPTDNADMQEGEVQAQHACCAAPTTRTDDWLLMVAGCMAQGSSGLVHVKGDPVAMQETLWMWTQFQSMQKRLNILTKSMAVCKHKVKACNPVDQRLHRRLQDQPDPKQ